MRSSVDPGERGALTNIFNKIPTGLKIRDKFKSKLRGSQSIEPPSPGPDGNYFKSLTNNVNQSNLSLKSALKKMMPNRTKTLNSDDNLSMDSEDLEFSTNQRKYNHPERVRFCLIHSIDVEYFRYG